jgi:integrase
MKKYPEPFKHPSSRYWYHKYTDRYGRRYQRSTGIAYRGPDRQDKDSARAEVRRFIDALHTHTQSMSFGEYAEPFFDWERCPRIRRMRAEDKTIGEEYAGNVRSALQLHVFNDKFSQIPLHKIKRKDVVELRDRIAANEKASTANLALKGVKAVLSEAEYLEEIDVSPARRVGEVKSEKPVVPVGVIHPLELVQLLDDAAEKEWPFSGAFRFAALTGMRSAEVYATMWRQYLDGVLTINQAFKKGGNIGKPKWDRVRMIPLCRYAADILEEAFDRSIRVADDDFIFSWDDGSRVGHTYFTNHYRKLIDETRIAGISKWYTIDRQGRNITPKSLRHSLNTHMEEAAVNPLLIRQYFGWSHVGAGMTETQTGYTHVSIDALKAITDEIDEMVRSWSETVALVRESRTGQIE